MSKPEQKPMRNNRQDACFTACCLHGWWQCIWRQCQSHGVQSVRVLESARYSHNSSPGTVPRRIKIGIWRSFGNTTSWIKCREWRIYRPSEHRHSADYFLTLGHQVGFDLPPLGVCKMPRNLDLCSKRLLVPWSHERSNLFDLLQAGQFL